MYKWIQRLTILIGILTIVLPIVFWSKIPEQIPSHYGASGMPDNYSDKSFLILMFLFVLILMGVMNIAVYYLKSNLHSKYTEEAEKSFTAVVYPAIVIMNLGIQVMFAYIMFCVTTGRVLGNLFLPVVLGSMVVLIGIIVYSKYKDRPTKALEFTENENEGEVYKSKVDWWLGLLLIGSVGCMIYATIESICESDNMGWIMIFSTLLVLGIIIPLFFIKYVLYERHLLISCGLYGKIRVPYESIRGIKETRNPLSSAAMSIDRIQIDYIENGVHKMVLISPKPKKEFIKKLEQKKL